MTIEENNRLNASISSYLCLLFGHFQSSYALKTLEYLIGQYKIREYNKPLDVLKEIIDLPWDSCTNDH